MPAGNLAGDAFALTLKGIATRSWGRTRAHLNAAVRLGTDHGLGLVHLPPRWSLSAAVDQTLLRRVSWSSPKCSPSGRSPAR